MRRNRPMPEYISLLMIVAGLALGPAYWVYVVHFTGRLERTVALQPGEAGAWHAPVFRLTPEWAPVGLILRLDGHFSPNMPEDQPPKDRYRATLYRDGVAGAPIPLDLGVHSVTDSNPRIRERLLLLNTPQAGDYGLDLLPVRPPAITLDRVELEIRSHVRQLDHRVVAAGVTLLALGVLLRLI